MKAIWKRETQGYFYSPVGYVFLGVFLAVSSVLFYLDILNTRSGDLPAFIMHISNLWMLLCPILTMRLLAEERQKKTDQLLLTSPVSLPGIVIGKYLAAVTVLLILSAFSLTYAGIVAMYGTVYPAELAVNYLGFILMGCAFAAMDLFLSGCASNPVTAAAMAFGANFLLWMLDQLELGIRAEWIGETLKFISLYHRNEPFLMGQLSFASAFYDLAFIAIFLMLTIYRLDRRRNGSGMLAAIRTRRLARKEDAEENETEAPRDRTSGNEPTKRLSGMHGSTSVIIASAVAVSLILLSVAANSLEKRNGWRADYSFNSITTHSDTTRELLKDLQHDVHIWALFRKGYEDAPLLELLDRYAAENHRITWEQADPAMNPELITRFSGTLDAPEENGLIVYCEDTDRWRLLKPTDYVSYSFDLDAGEMIYSGLIYERSISKAIWSVTRDRIPQVVIVQGHQERDADTVESFKTLLELNRYEVVFQDLGDGDYTPDPRDLLVFFSPQQDLTDEEAEKVTAFARAGGSFLFTRDYFVSMDRMPHFETLLRYFGFHCLDGLVYADANEPDTYYQNQLTWLYPDMCYTVDITGDLMASGMTAVFMPNTTAFETPSTDEQYSDNALTVFPVLQSSGTSHLGTKNGETGPFALALQARRVNGNGVSRAFITGNSEMLYDAEILNSTNSPQLLIRAMEFLLDLDASDLDTMEREAIRPSITLGNVRMGTVLITALPAAVLLAALLVLARRRRR